MDEPQTATSDPAAALYTRLLLAGFVLRITEAGRLSVSPADELDDDARQQIGQHAKRLGQLVREDELFLQRVIAMDAPREQRSWTYNGGWK